MNRYFLGVLIIACPFTFSAELSLNEFVKHAVKHGPKFKQLKTQSDRLEYIPSQGLPSRQVTLGISGERGFGTEGGKDTSNFAVSLSKDFIFTGTNFSVEYSRNKLADRRENVTNIRLEQSLFKNFFGADVRLLRKSLQLSTHVEKVLYQENYEQSLLSLTTLYLDFKKSFIDWKLASQILKEAKKLELNVTKRFKSKVANQTDVNRTKLLVLRFEEDVITKRALYQTFLQSAREALAGAIDDFFPTSVEPGIEQKIDKILNHSKPKKEAREITQIDLEREVADKSATLKTRELFPNINLVAGYNRDSSRRFSSTTNQKESVLGINIEIPIGNTQASADAQLARIEKLRLDYRKKELLYTRKRQQEGLQIKINELQGKFKIATKKVQLVDSVYKDELKRYERGRIDLDQMINITNEYNAIRFEQLATQIDLVKAAYELLAFKDQLLDYF